MTELTMQTPPVVTAEEWEAARQRLLVREKEVTRARDALAAERRRMPWLRVEQEYAFDGPDGRVSLPDLFQGRRQLIVYRVFFEPGVFGWPDHACIGRSLVADQVAHVARLNARDTTLAFATRAPARHRAGQGTMGWTMPWYMMTDDFDADFGVFTSGTAPTRSSATATGCSAPTSSSAAAATRRWAAPGAYLDITALGRQEEWEDSPDGYPQTQPYVWWNWHDEYGTAKAPQGSGGAGE